MIDKMIRTIEEARDWVRAVKVCTIFGSAKTPYPSLWDQVDLPDRQPGEKGWGEKVGAVWSWKNQLPALYPEEIFYGKVKGGFAVLMELGFLRTVHFPRAHVPVDRLSPLARCLFARIRIEPWTTTELRREVMLESPSTKSSFDTALKQLQVSLNVVRSNDTKVKVDTWLPFNELYPAIWGEHRE
jgi:hypothetical protein